MGCYWVEGLQVSGTDQPAWLSFYMLREWEGGGGLRQGSPYVATTVNTVCSTLPTRSYLGCDGHHSLECYKYCQGNKMARKLKEAVTYLKHIIIIYNAYAMYICKKVPKILTKWER